MAEPITEMAFNLVSDGGKPHEKNPQVVWRRNNPEAWLMIRPDRPFDQEAHRYPDEKARRIVNAAMKAWFEYLAAKGFVETFNSWLAILKSGKSLMVVCDDPLAFDMEYIPPEKPVLPADFWDEFELSRLPLDRRYEDPIERERVIQGFKDLVAEIRRSKWQKQVPGWTALGEVVAPQLREWTSPPALSAKAKASAGFLTCA